MRTVLIKLESTTPYSASKKIWDPLLKGEDLAEQDKRLWRNKAHYDSDNNVFIPGGAFKLALDWTVKAKNEKIKGKGNSTFTKLFQSGVSAMSDVYIGLKKADLVHIPLYVNGQGIRDGQGRVERWFPWVAKWSGELEMAIYNDDISQQDFQRFFNLTGLIGGVGRGRPSTGCAIGNGRFKVLQYVWSEDSDDVKKAA